MMDKEIKREIMLDHYNHPNNKMSVNDERYKMVHNASDSCIDDITVYMLAEDGVIKDVKFDGIGCTICTASTDITKWSMKSHLMKTSWMKPTLLIHCISRPTASNAAPSASMRSRI